MKDINIFDKGMLAGRTCAYEDMREYLKKKMDAFEMEVSDYLDGSFEENLNKKEYELKVGDTLTMADFVAYLSCGGEPPKKVGWDGITWKLIEYDSPFQHYIDEKSNGDKPEDYLPICYGKHWLNGNGVDIIELGGEE